ncbi:MAG: segregation/condensation protein A [Desulfomonile tiedjei]|nr:segregation/condensation protein A [Desulfomonile tiedjei]
MPYEIKLEVFEGPLDLLLHLIHRNEVSITDIPIALITQQYLDTVELMKSLNLDIAGEYLLMAAYLTHIKSVMLLPRAEEDQHDPDAERDPRDELVSHLLEYKRYKEAAADLGSRPLLDRDTFAREPADEFIDSDKTRQPIAVAIVDLVQALRELLARTPRRDLIELEPDRLLVKDKMREILERLELDPILTFGSIFEENLSRLNVLTTFLALLELVKLHLVSVYQDVPFGTILISRQDAGTSAVEEQRGPDSDQS